MGTSLARWQFATTSIYHFLFVPVTIGLAFLVAILQTAAYRSGDETYRRLTRFFGVLLLINVAVGVVTGLVQEFEFGMNWSVYSAYVGNIFGGPLAMEGLVAFFLESTFLGAWLFGWDRLPPRVHLACIWAVVAGSLLSAAFIMAANSWMQHPVGYVLNHVQQPVLTDVWALFTNPVFLWSYLHVVLAAMVTGSLVMLAFSAWHLRRQRQVDAFRRTATLALVVLFPSIILAMVVGSHLGVIETTYQPTKIAAAEAQWRTCQPCAFSLFQIGGGNGDHTPFKIIQIPHLLSLLATGTWNGKVEGLNQLDSHYRHVYGPGQYAPNVFIQYWAMRVMAYVAGLVFVFSLWGGWLIQRRRLEQSRWFLRIATWAAVTPFVMNTAGWLLTESGRQPWIVQGLLKTADASSPSVTTTDIAISLAVFVLAYIVLGLADGLLMLRYGRRQLGDGHEGDGPMGTGGSGTAPDEPALVY